MAEGLELQPDTGEAKYAAPRSEYAAVIFLNIPETYPVDATINCQYTLTSDLSISSRDWVGLYKVGWMSYYDYIYYEWAPHPPNYEVGKETESKVPFPASQLPKEDGEFYQFCYVTRAGQIRGASTPFQFRRPATDEFVEISDDESDMLVIRSKTVVLEEKLQKACDDKHKLVETQENMERERVSLIERLVDVTKKLHTEKTASEQRAADLGQSQEHIKKLYKETEHMGVVHLELKDKIEGLTKEKASVEKKVAEIIAHVKELNATIRALRDERDALMGKIKSLEEEKELYKNHFTSSESTVQGFLMEIDDLRKGADAGQAQVVHLKSEVAALTETLESEKLQIETVVSQSTNDKQMISELTDRVANADDCLKAAENIKYMLSEEVTAFHLTQEKMSHDLENAKLESDQLKEKLQRQVDINMGVKCDIGKLQNEKSELVKEVSIVKAEAQRAQGLDKQILLLEGQLHNSARIEQELHVMKEQKVKSDEDEVEAGGPLFALQMVNDALKDRLTKMKKERDEIAGQRDDLLRKQKAQLQTEHDLVREKEDLKERIAMCSEEYRTIYQKCGKIQKKLDKTQNRLKNTRKNSGSGDKYEHQENKETLVAASQPDPSKAIPLPFHKTPLEQALQDAERLRGKKEKFKRLLQDEKERQETIRQHYYDESRKAETQIEKYKKKLSELQSEFDLKTRAMQNVIAEKDQTIDGLNRVIRDKVIEMKDKEMSTSQMSASGCSDVVCAMPYSVLMYGNPYAHTTKDASENAAQATIAYPLQQIPAPHIWYPPTTTQPYPTQTVYDQPQAIANFPHGGFIENLRDSCHIEIDPLNGQVVPECRELDPPLQPTVLPAAKVAAVKSAIASTAPGYDDIRDDFVLTLEETEEKLPIVVAVDCADPEEDRFLDCDGEAMKICPNCETIFPVDITEEEFELHMMSHFGQICMICKYQADPQVPNEQFERHVQSHLEPQLSDNDFD